MWLEQTAWIWAPLACAAVIWTAFRVAALTSEVRRLRGRVAQLEHAHSDSFAQAQGGRRGRTAA
jgi:hypothetical protein